MKKLLFRDAGPADLTRIVEIYNSTVASRMVTADITEVSVESKQVWFSEHNPADRPLWMVATDDETNIGWVSFQSFYGRPAYQRTAELSIYLAKDCRGIGLGKMILEHCLKAAPGLGIKVLLGFIFAHNHPSIALFTKLGFEQWAFLPTIAEIDGNLVGLKILGIHLDENDKTNSTESK